MNEVRKEYTNTRTIIDGREIKTTYVEYRDDSGRLHRMDGPAYESSDGAKMWYINGLLHRDGKPAVEYPNGSKSWYINGKQHREDGPAVELSDGRKRWFINNRQLSRREFNERRKLNKSSI
jgi:hypothetical protein